MKQWLVCSRVYVTNHIIDADNVTERIDIDELAGMNTILKLRSATGIVCSLVIRVQDVFVIPQSYSFDSFPNVVIGRWYVDNTFLMFSRTHNMSIIDGTIFNSYHLGVDTSEGTAKINKYEAADWQYNSRRVSTRLCRSEGRLKSKEVFCQ